MKGNGIFAFIHPENIVLSTGRNNIGKLILPKAKKLLGFYLRGLEMIFKLFFG